MSSLPSDLPALNSNLPQPQKGNLGNRPVDKRRNDAAIRINKDALNHLSPKNGGHTRANSSPTPKTQAEWLAIMHKKKPKRNADRAKSKDQNVVLVPEKKHYSRFDTQLPIGHKQSEMNNDDLADGSIPAGHSDTILVKECAASKLTPLLGGAAPPPIREDYPLLETRQQEYNGGSRSSDRQELPKARFQISSLFACCCDWERR